MNPTSHKTLTISADESFVVKAVVLTLCITLGISILCSYALVFLGRPIPDALNGITQTVVGGLLSFLVGLGIGVGVGRRKHPAVVSSGLNDAANPTPESDPGDLSPLLPHYEGEAAPEHVEVEFKEEIRHE